MSSRAPNARVRRREEFQIAVICALPLEYDAVAFAFDEIWDSGMRHLGNVSRDDNKYTAGRIGSHNVVLLLLPGMGKVNAASAAASLGSSYPRIELAIISGICGGVPRVGTDSELLLGDVIISDGVMQFDLGKRYPMGFMPKDTVEENLGRPSKKIRSLIATFRTHHGQKALQIRASRLLEQIQQNAINDGCQNLYKRPEATEDRLFEAGYTHRHHDSRCCGCSESNVCDGALRASCKVLRCDSSRLVSRRCLETQSMREQENAMAAQKFQISVGRVGSGDTVMKSGLDRDRVAAEYNFVAFEMEGAGVWDEFSCIVVKGVCDYADSHKNKKWQHFAAATAASTTKAILEHYANTEYLTPQKALVIVPYIENLDFVGRSAILDQLKQLFGHNQHGDLTTRARSRVALYGLGGIGKTQIALAYVFWLQHAHPDISVFWVHASNAERFFQAYSAIAYECSIPGYDNPESDILALVKTWLERRDQGRWLMIVDNADDTQQFFPSSAKDDTTKEHRLDEAYGGLARYISECSHGSILITTRNKQVGSMLIQGKQLLEVGKMSDNEAKQLIHTILDDTVPADDTYTLSNRLEHLPLALAQAVAFIQMNSISVKEYIQLLDQSNDILVAQLSEPFQAAGRDSATPHAVTATWIVSFNQIQQQDSLASDVLSIASLLDRQGIPKAIITRYCEKMSNQEVDANAARVMKALGTLKAFSFISEADNDTVDMHRLVQLVMRKWLTTQGRFTEFAQHALETVSDVYPYGKHERRQLCRDYLPHANAVLQIEAADLQGGQAARASLLHRMTAYFLYLGQWKNAEERAAACVKLRQDYLGEEDYNTLTSISSLAMSYMYQSRYKEAEELELRVVETRLKVLGNKHPHTLGSMAGLVVIYMEQGQWSEAEELGLQVVKTRKTVLGEKDPCTLASSNSLALIHRHQGRLEEAEELLMWVMETCSEILGKEHPSTLTSMANLACTWRDQQRWDDAIRLMENCTRTMQKQLGSDHPETRAFFSTLSEWTKEPERGQSKPHREWIFVSRKLLVPLCTPCFREWLFQLYCIVFQI
ncbi:kinesin light chain [Colletotrichum truncatum]|uniref:Kinesin light chain n=1 Tax=Colletotrichum truncatum TaxID=5467 RepID=A0ACC3YSH9_COLTU